MRSLCFYLCVLTFCILLTSTFGYPSYGSFQKQECPSVQQSPFGCSEMKILCREDSDCASGSRCCRKGCGFECLNLIQGGFEKLGSWFKALFTGCDSCGCGQSRCR